MASSGAGVGIRRPAADAASLGVFTRLARTALFLEALQVECLEPHGLSFTDYTVLRVLSADEAASGVAPSRLAETVLISSGGMTKVIDRLALAGLVERSTDPNDRRGILVTLTATGRATSDAASASYAEGRARVLARLTRAERAAIDDGLQLLLQAFEGDRADRP
jgi:DNA-binding MarR family transcriptional regulator